MPDHAVTWPCQWHVHQCGVQEVRQARTSRLDYRLARLDWLPTLMTPTTLHFPSPPPLSTRSRPRHNHVCLSSGPLPNRLPRRPSPSLPGRALQPCRPVQTRVGGASTAASEDRYMDMLLSTAYTPCARLGPYAPPLSTAYYYVVSIAFRTQHDAIHSNAPFNTPERGP
jgi:hypothetical protein